MRKRRHELRNRRATFGFPPSFIESIDKYISKLTLQPGERVPSRTDIILRGTTNYMEKHHAKR